MLADGETRQHHGIRPRSITPRHQFVPNTNMSETAIELTRVSSRTVKVNEPEAVHFATPNTSAEDGLANVHSNVTTTRPAPSKAKTAVIIASITMVTGVASMMNGLVTVVLPTLQKDLHLDQSILLWYGRWKTQLRASASTDIYISGPPLSML